MSCNSRLYSSVHYLNMNKDNWPFVLLFLKAIAKWQIELIDVQKKTFCFLGFS